MIAYRTLAEKIAHIVEQWIWEEQLHPGQPIREREIAQQLQVSQTPVREAFRILEARGLLVHAPHKGTTVVNLTENDIRQILAVRFPLEVLALQLAREHRTPTDCTQLERLFQRLVEASQNDDLSAYHEAHMAFHQCIWHLSRNRFLADTLIRLNAPLWAFYRKRLRQGHRRPLHGKIEKHQQVLDFVLGRCPPEWTAEAVMQAHFRDVHS